MTTHDTTPRVRRPARRREGAAMLVVMLLLLMVTGTATFAIHSTTTEIRSTGYARQRMQTRLKCASPCSMIRPNTASTSVVVK